MPQDGDFGLFDQRETGAGERNSDHRHYCDHRRGFAICGRIAHGAQTSGKHPAPKRGNRSDRCSFLHPAGAYTGSSAWSVQCGAGAQQSSPGYLLLRAGRRKRSHGFRSGGGYDFCLAARKQLHSGESDGRGSQDVQQGRNVPTFFCQSGCFFRCVCGTAVWTGSYGSEGGGD